MPISAYVAFTGGYDTTTMVGILVGGPLVGGGLGGLLLSKLLGMPLNLLRDARRRK